MTKKKKNIIGIFTEGIGLYFSSFPQFTKYMTFPVLGQVAGLGIIFIIVYFYSQSLPNVLVKYPELNRFDYILILTTIVILPGLLLVLKAFWEYLVAYGALNSMFDNLSKSGKVYDFNAHAELIKKRTPQFAAIWLGLSALSLLAVCPFFTLICAIFAVYFVLVFQIFTFEQNLSPVECFKRSLQLIKGNFYKTFVLLTLTALLTYVVIPQLLTKSLMLSGLTAIVVNFTAPLFNNLPVIDLTQFNGSVITQNEITYSFVQITISQILICYTLPLRTIIWAIWYKELSGNDGFVYKQIKNSDKTQKKSPKRPSEKLMNASNKKYAKKKIDSNILRRAMEKDE